MKVEIELYLYKNDIYICRLRFKIMINFMKYVCYDFFFLNIQVEIGNYDLYLYAIISQIFELL